MVPLSLLPPTMRIRSMPIPAVLMFVEYRANDHLKAKALKFAAI
jgi:hypothetical protein